ncbi:uncharacterized protein LOC127771605 [Oryza glaberrima]|uniref:Uncharacterized protein n=1 Tax=Oryza barthii TaxID=65489 RepID=A0A0D3FX37_9ORYZ|nr:uncharacterized protein LOC127771605 [Oryza glaberrima]
MAAPLFTISGLREAAMLYASRDDPIKVIVTDVELRQAPALLELLTKASRLPRGWDLVRDHKLRQLARLANEIVVIVDVLVPMLRENALHHDAARLLLQYGWSLPHIARHVDGPEGPFHAVAVTAGNFLRHHVDHMINGTRDRDWLVANVERVRDKVADLNTMVVFIPELGLDDGPDGGEDDPEFGGDDGSDDGEDGPESGSPQGDNEEADDA